MRPLAWLAALCLGFLWLALPTTGPETAAVGRIGNLFQATVDGGQGSLGDHLVEFAANPQGGPGPTAAVTRLNLGGVRMSIPGQGSEDLTIHGRARRAVVAALRDSAVRRGRHLELAGEGVAVEGGVHLLISLEDGRLSAHAREPGGLDLRASIPSPPSDRRALLPALAAITLILLWRRPLMALLAALSLGAALLVAAEPWRAPESWSGFPSQLAALVFEELASTSAWKPMAAMIALLSSWAISARNGGLGGWTAWLSARATTARRAQWVTWIVAACAYFEAPGKGVALGWMLRTTAVRARVSAEKFAWILDSTSSAVLGLCLLSPWSAYAFELASTHAPGAMTPTELWLQTLPWRSFCWLTLGLSLAVILSGRDFGTMLGAERRAREGLGANAPKARRVFAAPEPDPRTALEAWRATAPFAVFALALLAQGLRDGGAFSGELALADRAGWTAVVGAMTNPDASLIAALFALVVALALCAFGGAERGVPLALLRGLRAAIRPALLILGAWAVGLISTRLGAAEVLAGTLGDRVAPQTLPALLFCLGAGVGLCFGSATAALALCVPLSTGLAMAVGPDFAQGAQVLGVMSLAAVLEGSVAGALLSPLSYSSLSASIGAGADHADHLRTRTPYVLLALGSALLFGFLGPGLFGFGPWISLALAASATAGIFLWYSRRSERRAS